MNSFLGIVGFLKTTETLDSYIIFDIVLGTVAFLYWLVGRPDYTGETRPLGITFLAVQTIAVALRRYHWVRGTRASTPPRDWLDSDHRGIRLGVPVAWEGVAGKGRSGLCRSRLW